MKIPLNTRYKILNTKYLFSLLLIAGYLLFPTDALAAIRCWDGGGGDANWSTAANWSGDAAPGSTDEAVFDNTFAAVVCAGATDATPNDASTIDSTHGGTVQSLRILNYTGTITQSRSLTINTGTGFVMSASGATFTGGSAAITLSANTAVFNHTNGTFTSTSGTLTVPENFTSSGGTFNHNSGTVSLTGTNDCDVTIVASVTFYNLSFFDTCGGTFYRTSSTITVNNDLTIDSTGNGNLFTGTGSIALKNNLILVGVAGGTVGGEAFLININDTDNQAIISENDTNTRAPNITVNKSSGTLTLGSSSTTSTINFAGDFILTAGTLDTSTYLSHAIFSNDLNCDEVITGNITFYTLTFSDICGGTFYTLSGTVSATNTMTLTGTTNLMINGGVLNPQAGLTTTGTLNNGTTAVTFTGTANQTFTPSGTTFPSGTVTINKTSGTVTLAAALTELSTSGQDLVIASGTLDLSTFDLTVADAVTINGKLTMGTGTMTMTAGTITISSNGTFENLSTGDLVLAGGQSIANSGLVNFNGGGVACPGTDDIALTRTSTGTVTLSGSGGWKMVDTTISNYTASPALVFFSSTNSGGNSGITFNNQCPGEPAMNWKLDEGQGTTAQDSSVNNNDGSIAYATWKTEDQCVSGKCLYFGGASQTSTPGGAADVTIHNNLYTASYGKVKQDIVWTSSLIGYAFYTDTDAVQTVNYKKTTDGGATWGTAVVIDSQTTLKTNIWYDRWTPNDTGTKIHIINAENTGDILEYRYLDTASDTVSSPVTVASYTPGPGAGWDGSEIEITKAEGGNLYISYFLTTEDFLRSTDGGATWTSRTNWTSNGSIRADDEVLLVPAATSDSNDIAIINWGFSNSIIKVSIYDDSANTWGSYVNVATSMGADTTWLYQQWAVSIRSSDKHAILTAWNGLDDQTTSGTDDEDLKAFDITLGATPTVSTLTDVLSNAAEAAQTAVFIDNNTDDIYVAYLKGGTWTTDTNVFYKKSTDGGTTWSTEVQVNTTQDDHRQLSAGFAVAAGDSGRFMPTWINDDLNDLVTNFSNSIVIPDYASVLTTRDINEIKSVSFWVKPNTLNSTNMLLDLNGTAKVTANSSGVISSGFTSPTYYINGLATTSPTITANTWTHVVITTGTSISGTTIRFGSDNTNYLVGFADEIKIYNSELTASEVKASFVSRGTNEGASLQTANTQNNLGALSNGLIGYWKLDESSGNASDSSGNSTTLTDGSSTTYATGKFANGADLESGSTDYLYAADSTVLSHTGSLTLSAWIKPETVSAGTYNILGKWDGSNESYRLMQNADEIRMEIDSNGNYQETSSSNLAAGTWYHVAGVYDASSATVRIYINGAQAASTTTGTIPSSIGDDGGRLQIGAEDTTGGAANYYDGIVDEARIYKRALNGNEISQLYNWAPGPTLYLKLDESTGTTIYDSSGNGRNGSLAASTSTPVWTAGKYGRSLDFDGTDDYATVTTPSLPTTDFTYELWHYDQANQVTGVMLASEGSEGGDNDELYWNMGGTMELYLDGTQILGTGAPTEGKWQHVVLTRSGSTVKGYIDGVEALSGTNGTVLDFAACPLVIGRDPTNGCNLDSFGVTQTGAVIDEIRVYNYARTFGQITEDMNAGHPAPGSPVGTPVGHWKFEEGVDNTCTGETNDVCNSGSAGNTYDGTSTADRSNSGKFRRALDFNGTDDVVTITNGTLIDLDSNLANFTFSSWIYADSDGEGDTGQIFSKSAAASDETYLRVDTEGSSIVDLECNLDRATTDTNVNITDAFAISTWTYVACTWDGTTMKVFVNGLERGSSSSGSGAIDADSHDLLIGGGTSDNFDGKIDEFKIYNSALTASQIALDMNNGSAQVMGALSDNTAAQTGSVVTSQTQEYCIPGDSTTCTAPVGRWDFEKQSSNNQTHYDTSGNGNNCTDFGGKALEVGKIGKATDIVDSVGGSMNCGQASSLDDLPASGMTIEGWIYPDNEGEFGQGMIARKSDYYATGWWFAFNGGGTNSLSFNSDHATTDLTRNTADNVVTLSAWNHVAVTWTGSTTATTVKIYINGREVTYGTTTDGVDARASDALQDWNFGDDGGGTASFDGKIDQFRAFNYVRTPAQIAWDYNRGGPVAHWKIDECTGTTVSDAAGNSLTGTWSGATGGNTSAGTCTTVDSATARYNGVTGKRNYSLDFDGTDDVVTITNASAIDFDIGLKNSVSFAGWVYADSDGEGDAGRIIDKGTNTYLRTAADSGGVDIEASLDLATADATVTVTNAFTTGTWNYVVMTYTDDGDDEITVYVNGIARGTSTNGDGAPAGTDTSNLFIGNNSAGSATFDGKLDDIKVFAYELTEDQVKLNMNSGATLFAPSTGAP